MIHSPQNAPSDSTHQTVIARSERVGVLMAESTRSPCTHWTQQLFLLRGELTCASQGKRGEFNAEHAIIFQFSKNPWMQLTGDLYQVTDPAQIRNTKTSGEN